MKFKKAVGLVFSCLVLGSGVPASAGTITYTCDPSIAASTCNYLNTTVAAQYSSTFTNASANIYIQYGTTGLASTESYLNATSYTSYLSALTANADQSSLQVQALAALNTYDTAPYGSGEVAITDALGEALGLTSGLTGIAPGGISCSFPSSGCYNAIVTVTNDPSTPLYYDNLGGPEPSDAYDSTPRWSTRPMRCWGRLRASTRRGRRCPTAAVLLERTLRRPPISSATPRRDRWYWIVRSARRQARISRTTEG